MSKKRVGYDIDLNGCWIFNGVKNKKGYGSIRRDHKTQLAHRYYWKLKYGLIKNKLCVLHKCDNPSCVNTEHLFLGTKKDNNIDMYNKGRQAIKNALPQTKIDIKIIEEIIKRRANGEKVGTLSLEYGLHRNTVGKILSGKYPTHYYYEYLQSALGNEAQYF